MINANGSVTINGITDVELAEILEIKAKNLGLGTAFNFTPQHLAPAAISTAQGVQNFYNNAQFNWTGEQGLKIVQEVITFLLTGKEKAQAQGQ